MLLVDGLKHNLLSVSQLCDKDFKVTFDLDTCLVTKSLDDKVVFKGCWVTGRISQSDWNMNAVKIKIFYPLTHQGSHAFHKNRRKGKQKLPL